MYTDKFSNGPIRKPLFCHNYLGENKREAEKREGNKAKVGHVPDISRWDARSLDGDLERERVRDADGCGRGYLPALMMLVASLTE